MASLAIASPHSQLSNLAIQTLSKAHDLFRTISHHSRSNEISYVLLGELKQKAVGRVLGGSIGTGSMRRGVGLPDIESESRVGEKGNNRRGKKKTSSRASTSNSNDTIDASTSTRRPPSTYSTSSSRSSIQDRLPVSVTDDDELEHDEQLALLMGLHTRLINRMKEESSKKSRSVNMMSIRSVSGIEDEPDEQSVVNLMGDGGGGIGFATADENGDAEGNGNGGMVDIGMAGSEVFYTASGDRVSQPLLAV